MKWLAAGLTFVNASTTSALLAGMIGRGLSGPIAVASALVGLIAAFFAYRVTDDSPSYHDTIAVKSDVAFRFVPYRQAWLWLLVAVFAIFAFRSFCWILYIDGNELKVQSPNNLGDLSLHLAYIKNFASGVSLWPDNPIYVFSKLRYPAGTDLFNALLLLMGVGVGRGLVWVGLISCAATCFALYRWGGCFGIAGFLFNGGIIGFQFIKTIEFLDYQGVPTIAWKSLPLTMLVPQRGVLYALPAGLLLLYHWRAKYLGQEAAISKSPTTTEVQERSDSEIAASRKGNGPLPFWLELSLYATMPLFHAHTFLALNIVLVVMLACGSTSLRLHVIWLFAYALIPASFIAWLITDHFHAGSVLAFHPGWVQSDGEFARPLWHSTADFGIWNSVITFLEFWLVNFGFWIPLVLALVGWIVFRTLRKGTGRSIPLPVSTVFVLAAILIFLLAFFVKTAPWGWDNIKILAWAYLIILPFLWSELLTKWPLSTRVVIYIALFASGFITLFGGLAAGRNGFGIGDRAEVDAVGAVVSRLPVEARFAAFPTYNHPLLLQGRKVVLGYPGHLWTQGFDYAAYYDKLGTLMQGAADWKKTARFFQARYLFWGREEKSNYPLSKRPWERESKLIATGGWGAIYDLEATDIPQANTQALRLGTGQ
ncbi:MAG: hypothetical protein M3N12_01800 [Verrucomicrobiota bacterium]|nr:hypothetical protein [Verrucomicrobiota bacterium]